ncbi:MAG: response regulator transcription factor [Pseudomonadota bacterium]
MKRPIPSPSIRVDLHRGNETRPRGKAHILICDDAPDHAEMLACYLNRRGYHARVAGDRRSLEGLIDAGTRVAVVLLGIDSPDKDGLPVLRRLRDRPDVAVLILTGATRVADRVLGLEMGADAYLTKPADPREVAARIRAILRRTDQQARPSA